LGARADTAGQIWEGIWGTGPDDIYVVGRLGDLAHFSGGKWRSELTGTNSTLTGVWGSGPNDVYVSVYSNLILHSTGDGTWTHETLSAGLTFQQVWGVDADTVLALGRASKTDLPSRSTPSVVRRPIVCSSAA
jgi:hypothetical protein